MRMAFSFLMLVVLFTQSAFADFGTWFWNSSYSDPTSKMGSYFTETTSKARAALNLSYLTPNVEEDDHLKFLTDANVARAADWDSFLELNNYANGIWKNILECTNGDIESARIAYYHKEFPCPKKMAKELANNLENLHQQLYHFLLTSDVEKLKNHFYWDLRYRNATNEKRNGKSILNPLVTQSLVELLFSVIRFTSGGKGGRFTGLTQGTWLDFPYSKLFEKRINFLLYRSQLAGLSFPGLNPDGPEFTLAKVYKNSTMLALLVLDSTSGFNWGLWPQLGCKIGYLFATQNWASEFFNSIGLMGLGCKTSEGLRYYGDESSKAFDDYELVAEFRQLAEKYEYKVNREENCFHSVRVGVAGFCQSTDPYSKDDQKIELSDDKKYRNLRDSYKYLEQMIFQKGVGT